MLLSTVSSQAYVSEDWHRERFIEFASANKSDAQAVLKDWLGFQEDMDRVLRPHEVSCSTRSGICARLAWIEKAGGNEAEFQHLLRQAVFYQRCAQLQEHRQERWLEGLSPSKFVSEAEIRQTQSLPPTNQEMYEVLHAILTLDRSIEVKWILQSDYDFDGFLATLSEGDGK